MKFVEGGKKMFWRWRKFFYLLGFFSGKFCRFHCPFCLISTEVPQDYFAYLDSEGRRVDVMQRAELCLGTYEFHATKEYCRNEKLPEPPAFIFMIDVSYRAVSSGMVAQTCEMLRTELESLLPVEASGQESKLRVGIATFSDNVNFFNLKVINWLFFFFKRIFWIFDHFWRNLHGNQSINQSINQFYLYCMFF